MKECNIRPPFTVSRSLACVQTPSPLKKKKKKLGERTSLQRLQVLLTVSTKSNYAWIHLNITAAMCLT